MKTVRKILLMLMAVALLANCSDPVKKEGIYPVQDNRIKKNLNIDAELTCQAFEVNEVDVIHFAGKTWCNLSENITFALHSNVYQLNNLNQGREFELLNGYFELSDDTDNSILSGDFQGQAYTEFNEIKIWGIINVNYGKGAFEADGGELRITIVGTINSGIDHTMTYTLQAGGFIEKTAQPVN